MMLDEKSKQNSHCGGGVAVVATLVDILIFTAFLIMLAVVITGGWEGSLMQVEISAHRPENPGLAMLALLLLRKLVDRRTPIREIPLVRSIARLFARAAPWTARRPNTMLATLVLAYVAVMGTVVCLKHVSFNSHAYDLGIFSQLIWSASKGFGLHSSILGHHFLAEHFSPILYLLVPGYKLWSHPFNLLLLQTIALSLAAVPLYLLAASELHSRNWGIFFALLYFCYQPMRNVNMYDFHPVALATPLLMLAFYLLHRRENVAFLLALAAALACKEEIAEAVFIFGVYAFLVQKRRIFGSLLAASGIAAFLLLLHAVIPAFRDAPYGFVGRYSHLGEDIPSILVTLATRPLYVLKHVLTGDKLEYLLEVFGPVAFLPFASPPHLLLAVPTLAQNLLSNSPTQYSITFQYTAALTPFVFISAVFGAKRFLLKGEGGGSSSKSSDRHATLAAVLLLLALALTGKSPVWHIRQYWPTEYTHYIGGKVLPVIPSRASVSAQEPFVPHLTARRELYEFPVVQNAEYVLLDSSANKWPLNDKEYFRHVRNLLNEGYCIAFSSGSVLLLERSRRNAVQEKELPRKFLAKEKPVYDRTIEENKPVEEGMPSR